MGTGAQGSARIAAKSRLRRWFWRCFALCIILIAGAIVTLIFMLRASLPEMDGTMQLAGLSAPATLERDEHGRVRIDAASWHDALAAQGVAHGQDRFFQMDLARRYVAGELAALVGANAVDVDRQRRVFQFRSRAEALYESMPQRHRDMLDHYTRGVNAGIASLKGRPPEYWILRQKPAPWTAVDCLLVQFFFFEGLSFNRVYEQPMGVMHAALPAELVAFLTPRTARWDRPMLGASTDDPTGGYAPIPIPGPDVIDLRDGTDRTARGLVIGESAAIPGSNNWAVAGSRTEDGRAIVANDPHLGLNVPAVWYDVELHWTDDSGARRFVTGASTAGVPSVIIGASSDIAWGVTNAYADHEDLVIIDVDPDDDARYMAPDGWKTFDIDVETIDVAREDAVTVDVRRTVFGPIIDEDHEGRPLALHATALYADMVTLDLFDLPHAADLDEAMDIGRRWWGPSQNLVVGDRDGRIGWIVTGYLPDRRGHDGSVPMSWADGTIGWNGPCAPDVRPMVVDPPDGVLFSANNRTASPAHADQLTAAWPMPDRANRIRTLLEETDAHDVDSLLAMQLDTVSMVHERMRDIVLAVIEENDGDPIMARVRREVEAWNGRADSDQIGFRLVMEMYATLTDRVFSPMVSACADLDSDFRFSWPLMDEALWRILDERPQHLLPPPATDWDGFLRGVIDDTVGRMGTTSAPQPMRATWGSLNQTRIHHPLGPAIPWGGSLLSMGTHPQSGWTSTVRVAAPDFGASVRLVMPIAPEPGEGNFQMPCGQSGHFLSPHYDDLHVRWLLGRSLPLRPQDARHTLRLTP